MFLACQDLFDITTLKFSEKSDTLDAECDENMLELKVMEKLRVWLNEECEDRHLSWREASINAGLNPGAISAIMNGQRPGLEICKGLARYFNVSPEKVLRLAGHLPAQPKAPLVEVPYLQEFAQRVFDLPPERQRRVMEAALLLLEIDQGGTDVVKEKVLS